MDRFIQIESIGSVSPLGKSGYTSHLSEKKIGKNSFPVFPLATHSEQKIKTLLKSFPKYRKADRSVHLALAASADCLKKVKHASKKEWVINAGSSRGATEVWEKFHQEFLQSSKVPVRSSPLTTLGNISSHIAQHCKLEGMQIDHSITCSSGLQALANGVAWLQSGLCDHFIAVGTEAPLTDFTIAQMDALGIYSREKGEYPCRPCSQNPEKTNTFVLGEAAVAIAVSAVNKPSKGIFISGIGTGSETIPSLTAISVNGEAFRLSMQKALHSAGIKQTQVDVIIPHSPGTFQGDQAEYNAIHSLFGKQKIKVINHKFLTGHTLGASGLLSVELAYDLLTQSVSLDFPYPSLYPNQSVKDPKTILINAMGFGGNAVSIILRKL